MFKVILIVIVLVIAGILVFAATRPDSFRVERSTTIKAPPDKVFAFLNDFHNWGVWSPWEKMDPNMKRTFAGAVSGQGSIYAWQGNSKVGEGRMEILEAAPAKVVIQLDFLKPFEAHNTAEFTLTPQGDATAVNWAMYGRSPYMVKVMSLFMNMDSMIGKDFEAGLANLKAAAEK